MACFQVQSSGRRNSIIKCQRTRVAAVDTGSAFHPLFHQAGLFNLNNQIPGNRRLRVLEKMFITTFRTFTAETAGSGVEIDNGTSVAVFEKYPFRAGLNAVTARSATRYQGRSIGPGRPKGGREWHFLRLRFSSKQNLSSGPVGDKGVFHHGYWTGGPKNICEIHIANP